MNRTEHNEKEEEERMATRQIHLQEGEIREPSFQVSGLKITANNEFRGEEDAAKQSAMESEVQVLDGVFAAFANVHLGTVKKMWDELSAPGFDKRTHFGVFEHNGISYFATTRTVMIKDRKALLVQLNNDGYKYRKLGHTERLDHVRHQRDGWERLCDEYLTRLPSIVGAHVHFCGFCPALFYHLQEQRFDTKSWPEDEKDKRMLMIMFEPGSPDRDDPDFAHRSLRKHL